MFLGDGLEIQAACSSGGTLSVRAINVSGGLGDIHLLDSGGSTEGGATGAFDYQEDDNFLPTGGVGSPGGTSANPGDPFDLSGDNLEGTVTFATQSGSVVSVTYMGEDSTGTAPFTSGVGAPACVFAGQVLYDGPTKTS